MTNSSPDNRFCAFLRGVNVKGTNMKMAEVCSVFERAGMKNVSAVLVSGNILFSSEKREDELKEILEKAMSAHFAYQAFLFVKNRQKIETILHENPFQTDFDNALLMTNIEHDCGRLPYREGTLK